MRDAYKLFQPSGYRCTVIGFRLLVIGEHNKTAMPRSSYLHQSLISARIGPGLGFIQQASSSRRPKSTCYDDAGSGARTSYIGREHDNVFVNIDVAKGGTFDTEGTHELVHAEQFEDGYLSFGKESPSGPWRTEGNSLALDSRHTKDSTRNIRSTKRAVTNG